MSPTLRTAGIAGIGIAAAGAVGYRALRGPDNPPTPHGPLPTEGPPTTADFGLKGGASLPEHAWAGGNDVELLVDYPDVMPRLLRDVAAADSVINIVQYIWRPDGPGKQLADLLIEKANPDERGHRVEVNVIVDDHGTLGGSPQERKQAEAMLEQLRAAGIHIHVNHAPDAPKGAPTASDHRKLISIDNEISYVGGMNMAGAYEGWHDAMLRVDGPASAQAGAQFLASWVDNGEKVSPRHAALVASPAKQGAAAGATEVRYLANTPGVHQSATQDLLTAARTAKRRLWVQTPNISDVEAARGLEAAARRGVDVHIIMAGPSGDWHPGRKQVSHTYYRDLIEAGVHVHEYPKMTHLKAWLVDDTLTLGSTNVTNASLRYTSELSATVRDEDVTEDFVRMYRKDIAVSDEITQEDTDGLGLRLHTAFRKFMNRQA